MTAFPYASDAKIAEALAVIEAENVGTREQTILQQILVACALGGVTPPSTLYFIDQGSALWADPDNWFEDPAGTIPHGAIPTGSDNCVINAGYTVNEVPSSGYNSVTNYGTVTANNGTINANNGGGTVTANNGTVTDNNGTVSTNNGTVYTNNGGGTVTNNASGGTVPINYGTVTDNYGSVTSNCGTVVNDYGYVGPC